MRSHTASEHKELNKQKIAQRSFIRIDDFATAAVQLAQAKNAVQQMCKQRLTLDLFTWWHICAASFWNLLVHLRLDCQDLTYTLSVEFHAGSHVCTCLH